MRSQDVADTDRKYTRVLLIILGIVMLLAPVVNRSIPWWGWLCYALAWLVWKFLPWKA